MRIALRKMLPRLHSRTLPRRAVNFHPSKSSHLGASIIVISTPRKNVNSFVPTSSRVPEFVHVKFLSTAALPPDDDDEEDEEDWTVKKSTTTTTTAVPKQQEQQVLQFNKQDVKVNKEKSWLWDLGLPSLLPEWRDMFRTSTLFTDISAGITVGCIAVPLSLAIAVASNVPPEVGLVTAAVSGVAGGLMGGTTLAITGPAAAISLLVVGAVHDHGLEALPLITLACGGLQVVAGVTRLGVLAKLVPVSVIAGFTTGVGAMILSGQVPKALGMTAPAGMNPLETVAFLGQNVASINPSATALAVGTSAAMFWLPKVHPKIPSALLAVGGATLATHGLGLDVALIGTIPSGLDAFQWALPALPPMEALPSLGATIFLIFAMTSAESLLSCAALAKMKKTSYPHNPDQELVGQGLANVGSAMFMGMPVTSVIARSSLNVRLNAESRLPALVQAGFVFGSVVYFSDSIATIPMPALSGMLITTGMGMLSPAEFKNCFAVQKLDTIPFLTTIAGMVSLGLAEGIGIGCLSAWALNYDYGKLDVKEVELPHKVQTGASTAEGLEEEHLEFRQFEFQIPEEGASNAQSTIGWQLKGPINFASMFEIDDLIHRVQEIKTNGKDMVIVFDMQETTSVEFTGVEELVNRLVEVVEQNPGTTIQMWNCHGELQNALQQCDPTERIARFCNVTSDGAPYHFPPKEEAAVPVQVPYWYDSPHFRPDAYK